MVNTMGDKSLFTQALSMYSKNFLQNYTGTNIDQGAKELTDSFINDLKKAGLKRIKKYGVATLFLIGGGLLFDKIDKPTLENICAFGALIPGIVTFSAARALASVYLNKSFLLNDVSTPIIKDHFLNKYYK